VRGNLDGSTSHVVVRGVSTSADIVRRTVALRIDLTQEAGVNFFDLFSKVGEFGYLDAGCLEEFYAFAVYEECGLSPG
jgi:hypothetical protein